jgi:hypothetical protein
VTGELHTRQASRATASASATGERCSGVSDGRASRVTGELHGAMAECGGDGQYVRTMAKLHGAKDV